MSRQNGQRKLQMLHAAPVSNPGPRSMVAVWVNSTPGIFISK